MAAAKPRPDHRRGERHRSRYCASLFRLDGKYPSSISQTADCTAPSRASEMSSSSKAMYATRQPLPTRWRRPCIATVGLTGLFKPLRRLTISEWRRVLDTNLTAAFLLAHAAEKPLRKARGAIVTIASTRAMMSEANTESCSASKGGLLALTHALAVSLAPQVRVNCVSPGWIETKDYAALRRKDHQQHPAGRVGRPGDVAELVGWLLDGKRSGFVTGANFVIDGGMTRKMIYEE